MAEGDFKVKAIVSADTSGFESGIKKAKSSAEGLSSSISNIGGIVKSALGFAGITASIGAVVSFGKAAVQAADEANQRFKILDQTVQATGASIWTSTEELEGMAKAYAKTTNYSVSEIEKMQSVLLGFKNITGETFGEASDAVLDMATVMGMDLTSAVQTVGKALDDPVKGLDSLRRQGFQFTDEQKEELAQLVKNGKQIEAQKIILDELAGSYGGAAVAGQSAFAQFENSMDDLKETLGNKLMPVVETVVKAFADMNERIVNAMNTETFTKFLAVIVNTFDKIISVVKSIITPFQTAIKQTKEFYKSLDMSNILPIFDTLIGVVKMMFGEFNQRMKNIISVIETIRKTIFDFVSNFLNSEAFGKIKNIIVMIIDMIVYLRNQCIEICEGIKRTVKDTIKKVWDKVQEFIDKLKNKNEEGGFFNFDFDEIIATVEENLNTIFRMFQDLIGFIKALFSGDFELVFDYAKLALYRFADSVLNSVSMVMNTFPGFVNGIINGINKIIEGINKVREWMGQDPLGLMEAFEKADLSESTGINAKIEELENKIKEKTGEAADYSIGEVKRISAASSGATKNIIKDITDTSKVEKKTTDQAKKDIQNVTSDTKGANKFFKALKDGFNKLKDEIEKNVEDWSDVVSTSYQAITGAFSETFTEIGEGLIEGSADWENYASAGVEAVAEVLKALGEQLLATAALRAANYDFASAALAAAGAAAAFVASGVLSSVAKQMKETQKKTDDATKSISKLKELLEDISMTATIDEYASAMKQLDSLLDSYTDKINSLSVEYLRLNELQKKYASEYERIRKNQEEAFKRNVSYSGGSSDSSIATAYRVVSDRAKKALKNLENAQNEYNEILKQTNELLNTMVKNINDNIKSSQEMIDIYNSFYIAENPIMKEIIKSFNKNVITSEILDWKKSLQSIGSELSDSFISGLVDGLSATDFTKGIKDFLRENMIKLSVYTDEYAEKMADYSMQLVNAMHTGNKQKIAETKQAMEIMYNNAKKQTSEIDKLLEDIFGSVNELIDSIEDMGNTIGENLVSALVDGLSQADFLEQMKQYIRQMLIQSLVYTETLKAEMNSIGEAISKGITEGFTETSLHEIKRDLSWTFDQANKTLSNIDSVINKVFAGGYANGTNSATRGLHLVGEAGPELVNFRGGEQVLNNRNTQNALQGSQGTTINQNVVFNNLQDTSAFTLMQQFKNYNREMAINGII